jgi:DNA-binding transcriptional LysR family regulator
MTLEQLKTFLWVARLEGVRRAAEQMNVSQPAVTARLHALEDSLRVQLFERTTRGVQLTREGMLLQGYAEKIFFVQQEILQRVADKSGIEGLLRIGASETIAESWLPLFLKRLSQAFPGLDLELTVDISLNLREALLARKLDLAILMGPVAEYSVANISLPSFDLSWFRAPCEGETDFLCTPVISYARHTRPYQELVAELGRRFGPRVRVYSCASLSASIQMIASGIGVGPIPTTLAREWLEAGQLEPFDPGWKPEPLHFTVSWMSDPRNALAEECAAIAREVAENAARC